jgi:ArsR family transcriptional regulator, lead/cadmium/zinc/bismuth-responsive transcriptional repressor
MDDPEGTQTPELPHEHPVDPQRVIKARQRGLSPDDAGQLTDVFRLLGDPVRTRIAWALLEVGELCVGDLALALDTSENTISYGLRMLRMAKLVNNRREGRVVYYRLADGPLRNLLQSSRALISGPSRHQDALAPPHDPGDLR